jgi:hypothetical protein
LSVGIQIGHSSQVVGLNVADLVEKNIAHVVELVDELLIVVVINYGSVNDQVQSVYQRIKVITNFNLVIVHFYKKNK